MKTNLTLISIASSLVLTACGGGSTGATSSVTPPVSTPGVTPANLQTTVPNPTYATNSVQLQTFTELNAFRVAAGLGKVAQSAALDRSAQNHDNYMVLNQIYSHFEDAGKPGFTGVDPQSRGGFVSYGGLVGEALSFSTGCAVSLTAIECLKSTVYHRSILLDQSIKDVGIDFARGLMNAVTIDVGSVGVGQNNSSDFVTVYPLDGQTNVPLYMSQEAPDPTPDVPANPQGGRDFALYTTYPISVNSARGTTISVTSFTVTENGNNAPQDLRILTAKNDPNRLLAQNEVYAVGKKAFAPSTDYSVHFSGSVNGKAIDLAWSFRTTAR
ncbi:CAP domain-containing protein [Undibacterium terreum]|nr:CAP domain-containing protein [Undibacterium terreum]